MIGVEMYHNIRTLSLLGMPQRRIAQGLRLSKTTVNKYCNMSEEEYLESSSQSAGKSVFSVAEDYILERLQHYPKLRLSRLYFEVIKLYPEITAKQRAFRKYAKPFKDSVQSISPRVFAIIETEPGRQVQVDMGETLVDCSLGGKFKVYFCCFILSFSRYVYVHCQKRPYNTADFIEAHRQSFSHFEGIAHEYVYDQTKLVAIQEKYREVIFNEAFHQFALKAGFFPHVCEGYDPQSKGKVERCVSEVKHGLLYGQRYSDMDDLRHKLIEWLIIFNKRTHATTQQQPLEVWNEEKHSFRQIPDAFVSTQTRKADKTGIISYSGNKYSVPMAFQGRQVIVEETDGNLHITDPLNRKIIATHSIPNTKGNLIKNCNHYRDFSQEIQVMKAQATELLSSYDPEGKIVERIIADNPKILRDQLRAVIKMAKKYSESIWLISVPIILNLQTIRATKIEKILQNVEYRERLNAIKGKENQKPVAESVLQRSLNTYMEVLKHDRKH